MQDKFKISEAGIVRFGDVYFVLNHGDFKKTRSAGGFISNLEKKLSLDRTDETTLKEILSTFKSTKGIVPDNREPHEDMKANKKKKNMSIF